MGVHIIIRENR